MKTLLKQIRKTIAFFILTGTILTFIPGILLYSLYTFIDEPKTALITLKTIFTQVFK